MVIEGTTRNFAESLNYIVTLLDKMGYDIVRYTEPLGGGVSLSGYDEANNYVEFQDLTLFTVGAAVTYVERLHRSWQNIYNNGLKEFMARYNALSPQERQTLQEGFSALQANPAENVPDEPEGPRGLEVPG